MADADKQAVPSQAVPSLGDFFAKKNKKKGFKGTNMNNDTSKVEVQDPKTKKKDKADEGWEDEEIVAPTMNIEMAGRLTREEESNGQEDTAAPAWGSNKKNKDHGETRALNEKKFPSLAKSVGMSSNINIDDGSQANINIKTSKNVFAALEDEHDEDAAPIRPKEIKPAMVTKVKGERERVALQREVDKYSTKKDGKKEKKKKQKGDDGSSSSEEEEEEEEEDEDKEEKPEKQKKEKKAKQEKPEMNEEVELAEDVKIVPDEKASRAKFVGREKQEVVPLRKSELEEEEKENRGGGISKKRQKFRDMEEVQEEKQMLVADWD